MDEISFGLNPILIHAKRNKNAPKSGTMFLICFSFPNDFNIFISLLLNQASCLIIGKIAYSYYCSFWNCRFIMPWDFKPVLGTVWKFLGSQMPDGVGRKGGVTLQWRFG